MESGFTDKSGGVQSSNYEGRKRDSGFHPLRAVRRLFRRKSKLNRLSGIASPARARSTSELSDVQNSNSDVTSEKRRSTLQYYRQKSNRSPDLNLSHFSQSHDSIFDAMEASSNNSFAVENKSNSFQDELRSQILLSCRGLNRNSADAFGSDDVGLPISPMGSGSIDSLLSKDSSDELWSWSGCMAVSRQSSRMSLDKANNSSRDSELDMKTESTPLNHNAAKHKLSIKPKRTHAIPKHRRLQQLAIANRILPSTPEDAEECPLPTPPPSPPNSTHDDCLAGFPLIEKPPVSAAKRRLQSNKSRGEMQVGRSKSTASEIKQGGDDKRPPDGKSFTIDGYGKRNTPQRVPSYRAAVDQMEVQDSNQCPLQKSGSGRSMMQRLIKLGRKDSSGKENNKSEEPDVKEEKIFTRLFGSRRSCRNKKKVENESKEKMASSSENLSNIAQLDVKLQQPKKYIQIEQKLIEPYAIRKQPSESFIGSRIEVAPATNVYSRIPGDTVVRQQVTGKSDLSLTTAGEEVHMRPKKLISDFNESKNLLRYKRNSMQDINFNRARKETTPNQGCLEFEAGLTPKDDTKIKRRSVQHQLSSQELNEFLNESKAAVPVVQSRKVEEFSAAKIPAKTEDNLVKSLPETVLKAHEVPLIHSPVSDVNSVLNNLVSKRFDARKASLGSDRESDMLPANAITEVLDNLVMSKMQSSLEEVKLRKVNTPPRAAAEMADQSELMKIFARRSIKIKDKNTQTRDSITDVKVNNLPDIVKVDNKQRELVEPSLNVENDKIESAPNPSFLKLVTEPVPPSSVDKSKLSPVEVLRSSNMNSTIAHSNSFRLKSELVSPASVDNSKVSPMEKSRSNSLNSEVAPRSNPLQLVIEPVSPPTVDNSKASPPDKLRPNNVPFSLRSFGSSLQKNNNFNLKEDKQSESVVKLLQSPKENATKGLFITDNLKQKNSDSVVQPPTENVSKSVFIMDNLKPRNSDAEMVKHASKSPEKNVNIENVHVNVNLFDNNFRQDKDGKIASPQKSIITPWQSSKLSSVKSALIERNLNDEPQKNLSKTPQVKLRNSEFNSKPCNITPQHKSPTSSIKEIDKVVEENRKSPENKQSMSFKNSVVCSEQLSKVCGSNNNVSPPLSIDNNKRNEELNDNLDSDLCDNMTQSTVSSSGSPTGIAEWKKLAQQRREQREQREKHVTTKPTPTPSIASLIMPTVTPTQKQYINSRTSKVLDLVNNFQKLHV